MQRPGRDVTREGRGDEAGSAAGALAVSVDPAQRDAAGQNCAEGTPGVELAGKTTGGMCFWFLRSIRRLWEVENSSCLRSHRRGPETYLYG